MSDSVPLQRLQLRDSIVTGEAVSLDISVSSPLVRIAAAVVDIYVYLCASFVLALGAFTYLPIESGSTVKIFIIGTVCIPLIFLPLLVEFLSQGQSLGKWAFGLEVVRDDGGPISLRHSLVRTIVGVFEIWLTSGSVAFLSSLLHRRGKRLGDIAAGTMVIQHSESQISPAFLMPPDAYEWSQRAHVMVIPAALAQRATMFIRSNGAMAPHLRDQAAMSLLAELSAFVEPKPPAQVHPERAIVAILVLNRNRDIRRLLRWDNSRERSLRDSEQEFFGL